MTLPDARDAVAVGVIAVVAAGAVTIREALGLPVVAVLALVGVAVGALAVVACCGGDVLGFGLLAVGVGTSSWNAVAVGLVKLTHVALMLAGVVLVLDLLFRRRSVSAPLWVWWLAGAIVLTTVASVLRPLDPVAFAARYDAGRGSVNVGELAAANLTAGLQWLVAVLLVPLVVCVAVQDRPERLRRLVDAWIVGATVNAAVAVGDEVGLTRFSALLVPEVDIGGRQAALTVQPNHAAVAIAMTLPLVLWRTTSSTPSARRTAAVATVILGAGLVTTGSRAGLVAAVLGTVLVVVLHRPLRRYAPLGVVLGIAAAVVLVATEPAMLDGIARGLRLVDGIGADASDAIRARLAEQAVADVTSSPLIGIGPAVANQAHNIYLQLLASGGAVLLLGYLAAQLGFLAAAWDQRGRQGGIATALAASGITFLVAGAVSNQLADVFVAIPFALMAALASTADRLDGKPRPPDPDVEPPALSPTQEVRT